MADMTNYERIKNMSVEEMAQFICGITIPNYDEGSIKQWLESEVE